jgi:hypothetical protein
MGTGSQVKEACRSTADRCRAGYERGRKGIVYVITSDKIIQSVLTGAVTSVIFSFNEGVATYLQRAFVGITGVFVPVKFLAGLGAMGVFIVAYYADQHTEEWREYVRDTTGEDVSEDTASEQDVTGEEKEE